MAKDAKGHGSNARGGDGMTGRKPTASERKQLGMMTKAFSSFAGEMNERNAAAHSEPQVQANIANTNAAAALAQGHPKSAPVDVHPSMEQQMESHPAHSRVGGGDYSPSRAVAAQHGISTSHLDAMKEAIKD